jgi:hypothetical protein
MEYIVWFLTFVGILLLLKRVEVRSEKKSQIKEEEEIIVCRSECFNNQIFVWNIKDDTFIGQGKSVEEIVKIFMTKYPNTSMKFNWKAENE